MNERAHGIETLGRSQSARIAELLGEARGRGWACFAAVRRVTDPSVLAAMSRTPTLLIVEGSDLGLPPRGETDGDAWRRELRNMYQAVSQGNRQAGKTGEMLHRHLAEHAPDGALDAVRQTGGYGREQDPYMNCKLMVLAEPMGDGEAAEWRPTVSWCGSADLVPGMEGTGLIVRDPETARQALEYWNEILGDTRPIDWERWIPGG